MTLPDDKPDFFLLTKDFLDMIVKSTEGELSVLELQLQYYLSEEPLNRYIISLLTELYNISYRITKEFKFQLKNGLREKNSVGEECIRFAEEEFFVMQQAIMSRHLVKKDIVETTNCSIFKN